MRSVEGHRALVERLEREAQLAPARYKGKVALLAALGFAVLGGSVLVAFGLSAGLVAALVAISPILLLKLAKIIWIPVLFGWLALRALWVRFAPPEGHALAKDEAPALRREVERLRREAGAPTLHGIVIDPDFNAAAVSVPRAMGLLGHRHYLVLGLPLMQALGRDEFLAVLAHEFGHFGGGHGRFTGWIYHVRLSWFRLLEAVSAQGGWFARQFARFFAWYAPYFNAYSFALARANEYQADATAARLISPAAMAAALVRTELGAARLAHDFWPRIGAMSREQREPPEVLYGQMRASLCASHAADAERLAQSLQASADLDDTHPSLAQRLAALGVGAALAPASGESAAEALLGEVAPRLEAQFSAQWRAQVQADWEARHAQHASDRARLTELQARADALSAEEAVERARLLEELEPDTDLLVLYRGLEAVAPDSAFVHYRLGLLLLERDDADGVGHLQRAIELEPGSAEIVLPQLHAYYRRIGDAAGEREVLARFERLDRLAARDAHARSDVGLRDAFAPHGLDAETLAAARAAFARAGNVGKAWIARKRIDQAAHDVPHYVVAVQWRGLVASEAKALQRVVDALELPGTLVVVAARHRRIATRRIRKACGEPVYRHGA